MLRAPSRSSERSNRYQNRNSRPVSWSWGSGCVGVTLVANTADKVNRNYTHHFTENNCSLVVANEGANGLRVLGGRLRTRNIGILTLTFSIHGHRTTEGTISCVPRS